MPPKRKLDTANGQAAEGASKNTQNTRVTRRSAASQVTRDPHGNDKYQNNTNNTPGRRSRIIKLNTRGVLPNNTNSSNARETRASRGQRVPAPSSISQAEPVPAASQVPETPRVKRMKRGSVAEESPRSTRQSARIRAQGPTSTNDAPFDEAAASKPLEPSPTKATNKTKEEDEDLDIEENTKSPPPDDADPEVFQDPKSEDPGVSEDSNPGSYQVEAAVDTSENKAAEPPTTSRSEMPPLSSSESQKYGSLEAENDVAGGPVDTSYMSPAKPKFEATELDRALEQQLQNGMTEKHDSQSAADATEESGMGDDSRQITDVEESLTPNGIGPTSKTSAKSRIGAAGRAAAARGRAKGKGRPRGKAVAGRRITAGRSRQESPDARPERSPSPSAAARKLLDRKSELDRAFKKVAAAQRLALHVMAVRTERQLARDKHAHQRVPEFEKVEAVLMAYRQRRQDILRHEYEFQVEQENLLFASEKDRIERELRESACQIQEEHLLAAKGDYMAFVEGRRAAEDDEHTETDGSETESNKRPAKPPTKEFIRGFNSTSVRAPAGAAAYERAYTGWEHFVQRARLGEDIDPQMKEMKETNESVAANQQAAGALKMLLEATGVVANQPTAVQPAPEVPISAPAVALSALADVASSEAQIRTPRPSFVQAMFPQPMDPRSYMLARPAPPPPPPRQTRPLLPAVQPIPSINEQLGLPDPFSSGGGPPQLPPPAGSNFQRPPPPPGFLHGNPLYFPPPRPPGHHPY